MKLTGSGNYIAIMMWTKYSGSHTWHKKQQVESNKALCGAYISYNFYMPKLFERRVPDLDGSPICTMCITIIYGAQEWRFEDL